MPEVWFVANSFKVGNARDQVEIDFPSGGYLRGPRDA
jgi:hypothetical protein